MAAFSGVPPAGQPVPPPIRRLAGGRPLRPVWLNQAGGLTFQIGTGPGRTFAKWAPAGSGLDLAGEATRMNWAARFTAVPRVLDLGSEPDGDWLHTAGLPGQNAVSARWRADPATATAVIGRGLRHLHDTLPVVGCPFSWMVEDRLAAARDRAAAARSRISAESRATLASAPPIDRLVVCHGDSCAPNTLINDDGSLAGHVDLGAMGRADRWADLAVILWNLDFNYGPGWQGALLDAYGVAPDPERIAYYRLLGGCG